MNTHGSIWGEKREIGKTVVLPIPLILSQKTIARFWTMIFFFGKIFDCVMHKPAKEISYALSTTETHCGVWNAVNVSCGSQLGYRHVCNSKILEM